MMRPPVATSLREHSTRLLEALAELGLYVKDRVPDSRGLTYVPHRRVCELIRRANHEAGMVAIILAAEEEELLGGTEG